MAGNYYGGNKGFNGYRQPQWIKEGARFIFKDIPLSVNIASGPRNNSPEEWGEKTLKRTAFPRNDQGENEASAYISEVLSAYQDKGYRVVINPRFGDKSIPLQPAKFAYAYIYDNKGNIYRIIYVL